MSHCLLCTFEALIYTSGKPTRLLFVPQHAPLCSRQSPARAGHSLILGSLAIIDYMVPACVLSNSQPGAGVWFLPVKSSPAWRHAEKWRNSGTKGRGGWIPYSHLIIGGLLSLSRKWFWQVPPRPPPIFCVFSLSCSPINKSLCKAVCVRLHWCEWVCGSFSISWVIMKCSMLAEVIKNASFYKKRTCNGLMAVVSSCYERLCQFYCEPFDKC